jgi:cytoskeletal protein RodZ
MSDVKLSFDTVVVEGVNIKRVAKSYSKTNNNYNNATKKDIKDTEKTLKYIDKWIEAFSAISDSENKYDVGKYDNRTELAKSMNFGKDYYQASHILLNVAVYSYPEINSARNTKELTASEIVLACNVYATEVLEKRLSALQTELEKTFTDDQWLLHLTFSQYCWIEVKGAAAKKVYSTLLDEKDHTFVFKIDPKQIHKAEWLYKLTLTAIDAEEA